MTLNDINGRTTFQVTTLLRELTELFLEFDVVINVRPLLWPD